MAQEWEQAMQAMQESEATRAAQREAHNRRQYKKAKVDWYSLRGTPGWGYRAIAKHRGIPPAWVCRLSEGEYLEGLDDPFDDDDDDDSGDYDSD